MPPNVALEPSAPLVPEEPAVPLVPLVPDSPLSPVRAKVNMQSSPLEKGFAAELSTGEITTLKYPVFSVKLDIVNNIKAELS